MNMQASKWAENPRTTTVSSSQNTSEQQPQDATTSNETVLPESDSVKQFSSGAVRGNRLQTGGIQKPKLTEDELSARLEAAKINNARREEAHRLAEADEASFQHRETQAREKRREEGVARRAMEGERERNRLRKLGARGNREWDEAKKEEEEEFTNGRSRGYRRGMHGGLSNNQKESGQQRRGKFSGEGEDEELSLAGAGGGGADDGLRGDFRGRGRDRGRGGKGRGRGGYDSRNRGGHEGGRGDYGERRANHHNISAPQPIPAVNVDAEFPKISSGNAPKQTVATNTEPTALTSEGAEALKSPIGEKTSWADQVEAVES
ncbi:hypothetical protein MMC06_004628 [Schaereria dolodes]|nr:hypothetical protein [Schaereria dolodes]